MNSIFMTLLCMLCVEGNDEQVLVHEVER